MNFTWLYIGILYVIAVALARRAGVDLPKRIAFFFYILVLIFFRLALTQPYVNYQVDVLNSLPPWAYVTTYWHQYTSELNDLPLQIVPWAHQVRESWKALDAPLWNAASGAGYPLLGNGQSSALSLLRILALPLSLGRAMSAEAAMKVLIALTFAFLFCRRRYSLVASTIAAVTFGFCGFIIGWLHFPIVTAACLAPAVLYCADLLIEKRTWGRFVFAAAMWAQLLVAGHPETAAHLFWLAAMYVLWILFIERAPVPRMRTLLKLGYVLIVAALLAAPYLGPLLETIPKSKRIAELEANPLVAEALPNTDRHSAILLLQPHFFGQAPIVRPWSPSVTTEGLSAYVGVLGWIAWIAVALHVVWTRAWRSREAFFAIVALFAIGVVFAWPGVSEAFHLMMPIAAHSRLRLIFALLLAVQTAAAVDLARRVPLLAGVLAIAALLLTLLHTFPVQYRYQFDMRLLAMLPSALVLAAATWFAVSRRQAAVLALLVTVIIELFAIGRNRPTPLPEQRHFPTTPLLTKLHDLAQKEREPFRIVGMGPQFFPNANAVYGYEDIRAHDPMSNARYLAFLRLTADYDPWNYHAMVHDPNRPVYDFLNVKYLITDQRYQKPDLARWSLVYDGRDGRIFENRTALPRFFAVRNVILEFQPPLFYARLREHRDWGTTAILDELQLEAEQQRGDFFTPRPADAPLARATIVSAKTSDYRLKVEAPRWSLVASSIPWWPGWVVERNGERVEPIRVNAVFLGFAVPPGTNDVRVVYRPWSFWIGVWIALATVIGICGSAVRARRYRPS